VVGGAPDDAVHVWCFPERGCAVRIPGEVLSSMWEVAANSKPRETGGTLVGHYSEDLRDAFVTAALEATIGAGKQRARFYRPPDNVDGQLARIYDESGGLIHYLGEWHTHPDAAPTPSPTDLSTLRSLARSRSVATDTPFMVILGGSLQTTDTASCTLAERTGRTLIGLYEQRPVPTAETSGYSTEVIEQDGP
jgi:integrative and conjugative element protein (TIGR02256 family)